MVLLFTDCLEFVLPEELGECFRELRSVVAKRRRLSENNGQVYRESREYKRREVVSWYLLLVSACSCH